MTTVTTVETNRITGQKPPHYRRQRDQSCSQQQMRMIGDQHPCVTRRSGLVEQMAQSIQEVIPIRIILKYLSPFDPSQHNVVQGTRAIQTTLTRHALPIPTSSYLANQ
jgi:hypothetical protein